MLKSKTIALFFLTILLIFVLLTKLLFIKFGTINTLIIGPLFFLIFILIFKFITPPIYNSKKYKKNFIQYIIIGTISYIFIYFFSGLFSNFGNNPYTTGIKTIFLNIFSNGIIIFSKEYIRYKFINSANKKNKKLIKIYLTIIYILYSINIKSFISEITMEKIFELTFKNILPELNKNLLFNFMVEKSDYIPTFIYEMILKLLLWVSPILPNSPWILESTMQLLLPIILLIYTKNVVYENEQIIYKAKNPTINPTRISTILYFIIVRNMVYDWNFTSKTAWYINRKYETGNRYW